MPELKALRSGEASAWDEAFRWLWPTAFAVAKLKLQQFLPGEIEDVAIEALEELVEKAKAVSHVEELKPLVASIAHHRAVSLLRERFAQKRGAGQIESLDALQDSNGPDPEPPGGNSSLSSLDESELAALLRQITAELKPEQKNVLDDFFLGGLTYEQIARKRGVAMGSVGVFLRRGLDAVENCAARRPQLLKELKAFLRCIV